MIVMVIRSIINHFICITAHQVCTNAIARTGSNWTFRAQHQRAWWKSGDVTWYEYWSDPRLLGSHQIVVRRDQQIQWSRILEGHWSLYSSCMEIDRSPWLCRSLFEWSNFLGLQLFAARECPRKVPAKCRKTKIWLRSWFIRLLHNVPMLSNCISTFCVGFCKPIKTESISWYMIVRYILR